MVRKSSTTSELNGLVDKMYGKDQRRRESGSRRSPAPTANEPKWKDKKKPKQKKIKEKKKKKKRIRRRRSGLVALLRPRAHVSARQKRHLPYCYFKCVLFDLSRVTAC
uniref:Uncharacterized protein n=1 Tax=Trichuris muris TaxID=70415 RepID=A0A5S6QHX6_TRIMR